MIYLSQLFLESAMSDKVKKTGITLKEIARLAGCSTGTVDRVIHNRSEVAKETIDRIHTIIKEKGYQPNVLARSLAKKREYNIAIIIPQHTDANPYWHQPKEGINKAGSEFFHYGFRIKYFGFDSSDEDSFKESATKALSSQPDGVILVPFFIKESLSFTRECDKQNIPYCFFDSSIKDTNYLSSTGQDAFQSGYVSAKLFETVLPDSSSLLIINFTKSFDNSNMLYHRVKGFKSYFESTSNQKEIKIIHLDIPDNTDSSTLSLDKSFIEQNDVKGIYIPNSRAFLVAKHLQINKFKKIFIIGYDLTEKNIHYMNQGIIDFLIGQRPQEQGAKALTSLFESLVLNKQIKRESFIPIDIIIKENLKYYLNS
jgi:LacI family transcriptional regulator